MNELFSLDLGRLLFVLFVLIVYLCVSIRTKKWLLSTSLFLLCLLPFNITLQIPGPFGFAEEYIKGRVSNYTTPTLFLGDVFVFFGLIFLIKYKAFANLSKNEKRFFSVLALLFSLKLFLDNNLLSSLTIFRLYFYALVVYTTFKHYSVKSFLKIDLEKIFTNIVIFSLFIQFLIGSLQFLYGRSLGFTFLGESQVVKGMYGSSFIELNQQLFLRAYGTFPHPNVLAGYLFFVLAFSLLIIGNRAKYILAFLCTILIVLTFSRVVILLTVGLWVLFFLQAVFQKQKVYSFTPFILERFTNFGNSYDDRIELIKNSFEIIKNYPLRGIGAGRFVYGIDYYPVYTRGGFLLLEPVHNIYLLLLAENGLLLGGLIVLTIFFLLTKIFISGNVFVKYLAFSILLISLLDHYFITLPQGLLMFAVVISALYIYSDKLRR